MTAANSQNPADNLNSVGLSVYNYLTSQQGDTYQSIHGTTQESMVVGTPGNDVIYGASGNELVGGGGNDALLGGAGNQVLFASTDSTHPLDSHVTAAGTDTSSNYNVLVGGPHDVLVGGPGQDYFVFGSHSGVNVIQNFDPVPDQLVIQAHINGSGIASITDLQSHISDSSQGTLSNFGGGDEVLLAGVHPNQLRGDDFAFV
jgi:Ca2+-binding RTX toxin-like protein